MVRHGIRDIKDAVSRDILKAFNAADISIATTAYNIGGFPPLRIENGVRPQEKGKREDTAY